ncbi:hypothetical protein Srufu_014340 [Streptomyces libani subsp. rufus]|nr:hypothetical protein Srufu_014340 [Streptomyces libani subsp. rufus]
MNIEGLRYAQAVSQTKSFSAAARDYGVTQPALSNGVARLEEELGVKLFDRSPRGVKPTVHGARILPMIDQALGRWTPLWPRLSDWPARQPARSAWASRP